MFAVGMAGAQRRRQIRQREDHRADLAGYKLREGKTSIHDDSSKDFMANYIGAGTWQQNVLEAGCMPNFKELPGKFRANNNKSASDNMPEVRAKLQEWLEGGHVEEVPWCVNLLTVAEN